MAQDSCPYHGISLPAMPCHPRQLTPFAASIAINSWSLPSIAVGIAVHCHSLLPVTVVITVHCCRHCRLSPSIVPGKWWQWPSETHTQNDDKVSMKTHLRDRMADQLGEHTFWTMQRQGACKAGSRRQKYGYQCLQVWDIDRQSSPRVDSSDSRWVRRPRWGSQQDHPIRANREQPSALKHQQDGSTSVRRTSPGSSVAPTNNHKKGGRGRAGGRVPETVSLINT